MFQKFLNTMQSISAPNPTKAQPPSSNPALPLGERSVENVQVEAAATNEAVTGRNPVKQSKLELEFQQRNSEILKVMPPTSKYDQLGYKYQYPVDLNTFFRVFLCKSPVKYQGKEYATCWEIFEGIQGTYQLDVQEWSRRVPNDVTSKKCLLDYASCLERYCLGRKKLGVSIPFVTTDFSFEQHNRLFFVNEKQIVVILELDTKEKIPLSDTFKFRTCYILTDETGPDGKPQVSMSFNYYVDWYKKTLLKPILLKAAGDEVRATGAGIDKIIRELLKDGVFEKKKEELEALKQEELPIEEEEENQENTVNALQVEQEQVKAVFEGQVEDNEAIIEQMEAVAA